MMEVKLGAKELREFEQAWNALSNPKHKNRYYNVSPSKEEYRQCWENGMPELFFDFGRWILREEAKTFLFRATDIIAKSDELYDVVSWHSIYETLKINLRDEISHRISGSAKQELNQVVSNIKTQLEYKVDSFDFFFPLEGIELHEIQEINLKNIAIVHFDEDAAIKLTRLHLKGTDDCDNVDAFESTKKFFDRDFTNQICVKSTAHGELSIARKKAYKQAKQVINYLRFIVCFLFHERITEQCIRINLKYEEYNSKEQYCAISRKDDIVTLGWGRGLQSIQKFPIDQNRLTNLHNDGYLEAFSSMISSSPTTDLEGLILTAMYWIGEAQNEHDLDIAYLKYWTVLESIFSEEANVTKSLVQGITIVNIFTPYRFIEISDVEIVSKRIDILYDKRSKIIHQGMNHLTQPVVTHLDVSEICKYASWSILALLDFRSQNYITISQIKDEIERLSAILSKDIAVRREL